MIRIATMTLTAILYLMAAPAWATEELSGDALVVQAKIPKAGVWLRAGYDSLWSMVGMKLLRINMTDNSFTEIDIKGGGAYRDLGVGEGGIWVPDLSWSKVFKVDPATNKIVLELPAIMLYGEGSVGVGAGAAWVVTGEGGLEKTLTRFNSTSGAAEAKIPLPSVGSYVLVDFGSVWVTGPTKDELYRIDPKTNVVVSTIALHKQAKFICSGEGSIWVLSQGDGLVDRVDGATGEVVATIDTGLKSGHGGDIRCGGGYVWVNMPSFNDIPGAPVVQIDPQSNTVLRKYVGGKGFGADFEYAAGSLWFNGAAVSRVEPPK